MFVGIRKLRSSPFRCVEQQGEGTHGVPNCSSDTRRKHAGGHSVRARETVACFVPCSRLDGDVTRNLNVNRSDVNTLTNRNLAGLQNK